jgi:DNA-binding transcriptional LysR family regulator
MRPVADYIAFLLAFQRAAEEGSFTAAARGLGLTPSAVSRAVTQLERRLGARLFARSTRALELTAEGRAFLGRIGPAIAALREAEGVLGRAGPVSGTVRVSASVDLARNLVALWAGRLARDHPGLRLELNVTDRLVDLRREGVDITLRIGSAPPSSLAGEGLGTIGYALVAAPAYLDRRGRPLRSADLTEHDCLDYLTNEGVPLPWVLAGEAIAVRGPFATDDAGALLAAALSGAGIAYMLRFAVAARLENGELEEVLHGAATPRLPVAMAHPYGTQPPARVAAMLAFLRAHLVEIGSG